AGLRQRLGIFDRPLLMSIFKPCLGLSAQALGEMFFQQAAGGVDLVKDDEILVDESLDTALARLEACLKAAQRAGGTVLYAVNLTGPAAELLSRAQALVRSGATCLLFNFLAYGVSTMQMLAEADLGVPIMAHPALSGAFFPAADHGIASHVLLGKIARLAGADLVLFPSPYGTVAMRRENALKIALVLTAPLHHHAASFPVPSAGITPGLVPKILQDFGPEVVVNAGGGIHGHPGGAQAGARAFRQAIEATLRGVPLADAAQKQEELRAALALWGPRP
ncbi:MAG: 2,3-diketo-5-methylthiopentyl-1-phosphate enolase, partial [Deinococcus sp.]|nr:2,3-diketo-5-methylthiopentyl-1-phosphate enolase [Deinococcus sp.]